MEGRHPSPGAPDRARDHGGGAPGVACGSEHGPRQGRLFKLQRGVAQLGSARRSGRRGRRFKSCHPDHRIIEKGFRSAGALLFILGRSITLGWSKDLGRPIGPGRAIARPGQFIASRRFIASRGHPPPGPSPVPAGRRGRPARRRRFARRELLAAVPRLAPDGRRSRSCTLWTPDRQCGVVTPLSGPGASSACPYEKAPHSFRKQENAPGAFRKQESAPGPSETGRRRGR